MTDHGGHKHEYESYIEEVLFDGAARWLQGNGINISPLQLKAISEALSKVNALHAGEAKQIGREALERAKMLLLELKRAKRITPGFEDLLNRLSEYLRDDARPEELSDTTLYTVHSYVSWLDPSKLEIVDLLEDTFNRVRLYHHLKPYNEHEAKLIIEVANIVKEVYGELKALGMTLGPAKLLPEAVKHFAGLDPVRAKLLALASYCSERIKDFIAYAPKALSSLRDEDAESILETFKCRDRAGYFTQRDRREGMFREALANTMACLFIMGKYGADPHLAALLVDEVGRLGRRGLEVSYSDDSLQAAKRLSERLLEAARLALDGGEAEFKLLTLSMLAALKSLRVRRWGLSPERIVESITYCVRHVGREELDRLVALIERLVIYGDFDELLAVCGDIFYAKAHKVPIDGLMKLRELVKGAASTETHASKLET